MATVYSTHILHAVVPFWVFTCPPGERKHRWPTQEHGPPCSLGHLVCLSGAMCSGCFLKTIYCTQFDWLIDFIHSFIPSSDRRVLSTRCVRHCPWCWHSVTSNSHSLCHTRLTSCLWRTSQVIPSGAGKPWDRREGGVVEGGPLLPAQAFPPWESHHLFPNPFLHLFLWPEGSIVFFLSRFLNANPKHHLNYGRSQWVPPMAGEKLGLDVKWSTMNKIKYTRPSTSTNLRNVLQ